MWQDYFAQHGYLEQTAGWQLALEGLLGEALTPVAFPEKASYWNPGSFTNSKFAR